MVLIYALTHIFWFCFVTEKQAVQKKFAEIGKGSNSGGLCWKHLTCCLVECVWQFLCCSSFDAFLTVKGDRSNKLIAATTV